MTCNKFNEQNSTGSKILLTKVIKLFVNKKSSYNTFLVETLHSHTGNALDFGFLSDRKFGKEKW